MKTSAAFLSILLIFLTLACTLGEWRIALEPAVPTATPIPTVTPIPTPTPTPVPTFTPTPTPAPPPPVVNAAADTPNETALIDAAGLDFEEKRVIEVYQRVAPSVVNITTRVAAQLLSRPSRRRPHPLCIGYRGNSLTNH
ncbi:MAG: hypothetical protein U0401_21160 [Anaerolineae bacterium]